MMISRNFAGLRPLECSIGDNSGLYVLILEISLKIYTPLGRRKMLFDTDVLSLSLILLNIQPNIITFNDRRETVS